MAGMHRKACGPGLVLLSRRSGCNQPVCSFLHDGVSQWLHFISDGLAAPFHTQAMAEHKHILFLTGRLALPALQRVLADMPDRSFDYEVRDIGVSVAALMTAELIDRRLADAGVADRVVVPGLCAGDLAPIAERLRVPVDRGPNDLKDLPTWLGGKARVIDLSRYDMLIFAEIVEAVQLTPAAVLERARRYAADGADVIDLGCMPGRDFHHLEDCVRLLKSAGLKVSVDSLDPAELRRGALAGADYLLSLRESTLELAFEVEAVPVLIPERPGDLESLLRAVDRMQAAGKPCIADSILDPVHFGFTESLVRYAELRRSRPDVEIIMGVGNLTELTDADTTGVNALLAGVMSELGVRHLLTTEVSAHARTAVREFDVARRVMHAARADAALPKGYSAELMTTHARRPHKYSDVEIREVAAGVRDPNFRIQVSESGIHVYNRRGYWACVEPFAFYPQLTELHEDAPHAFYMGAELARAQVAWQLGKPYVQDEELNWGAAWRNPVPPGPEDKFMHTHKAVGTTIKARRSRKGQTTP